MKGTPLREMVRWLATVLLVASLCALAAGIEGQPRVCESEYYGIAESPPCFGIEAPRVSMCHKVMNPHRSSETLSAGCLVVLICNSCGRQLVLESTGRECLCPSMEEENCWQISGSVLQGSQENLNNLHIAGSSFIPPLDTGLSNMIGDIITQLITMMRGSRMRSAMAPVNGSFVTPQSVPLRYRSLDILLPGTLYPTSRFPSPIRDRDGNMDTSSPFSMAEGEVRSPSLIRQKTLTSETHQLRPEESQIAESHSSTEEIVRNNAVAAILLAVMQQVEESIDMITEPSALVSKSIGAINLNIPDKKKHASKLPRPSSSSKVKSNDSQSLLKLKGGAKQEQISPLCSMTTFLRKEKIIRSTEKKPSSKV